MEGEWLAHFPKDGPHCGGTLAEDRIKPRWQGSVVGCSYSIPLAKLPQYFMDRIGAKGHRLDRNAFIGGMNGFGDVDVGGQLHGQ